MVIIPQFIDTDVVVPKVAKALGETLFMVTVSFFFAAIIGLVLGIFPFATRPGQLLHSKVAHTVLNIVVNTLRPIPFIILFIALTPLTRALIGTSTGPAAAILPLTIAASVGIARVAESNLVAVDPGVVEAAKAVGAKPLHILFGFVVREPFGPLLLSLTFIFVALIDATAVAGAVGGGSSPRRTVTSMSSDSSPRTVSASCPPVAPSTRAFGCNEFIVTQTRSSWSGADRMLRPNRSRQTPSYSPRAQAPPSSPARLAATLVVSARRQGRAAFSPVCEWTTISPASDR